MQDDARAKELKKAKQDGKNRRKITAMKRGEELNQTEKDGRCGLDAAFKMRSVVADSESD